MLTIHMHAFTEVIQIKSIQKICVEKKKTIVINKITHLIQLKKKVFKTYYNKKRKKERKKKKK